MRYTVFHWIFRLVIPVLLLTVVARCSSKSSSPDIPDSSWQSNMHGLSSTLMEIYPLVVSKDQFEQPENFHRIEKSTDRLLKLARDLNENHEKAAAIDKDPSLKLIAASFERELSTAAEGLRLGKRSYSRYVLKNATNYCIQCHTRGTWGPEVATWKEDPRLKLLEPNEKAEIMLAVRDFNGALEVYKNVLNDPRSYEKTPFAWEQAARNALNLAIRVKKDPDLALALTDQILSTPKRALFLKNDARSWRRQIVKWKFDEKRLKNLKDKDKLAVAKKILDEAHKKQTLVNQGLSYIHFLRASGLLHEFLRSQPSKSQAAEAYFLLGQAYEGQKSDRLSALDEYYYKACINQLPHSELSMKCYTRYEEIMYFDFSGSGGLAMPPSALTYLNYLRELAAPKKAE
ncbi:MAG: hypothetical protein H6626_04805 [Pseudobdellovibrionaceae bacterium]|nr:MAG: hypothetical protein H6626_04805 [Pseudobdellovibrionaceae bacterium]